MLKKRIIGVVTVRQGLAVQSFNYSNYLPLGKPEVLVENLDRWEADEILIQCIDRSPLHLGPDFALLKRLGALGLSTPLIYSGGIRNAEDALEAVSLGADRISLDAMLRDNPSRLEDISRLLGKQAVIVNMPLRVVENKLLWKDYKTDDEIHLTNNVLSTLPLEWISEIMLTDWLHEGVYEGFNPSIPALFPTAKHPLLLFGGLSNAEQYRNHLCNSNVVAIAVGNFLNYKEHAIQEIKQQLTGCPVRIAQYSDDRYSS